VCVRREEGVGEEVDGKTGEKNADEVGAVRAGILSKKVASGRVVNRARDGCWVR